MTLAPDDAALEVSGLAKIYRLAGSGASAGAGPLSFRLEVGAFLTLLGPSGCGKTTTLRCIAGLEQPDQGTIRLGPDIFYDRRAGINVPLNRRNIGMVFQSYAIWPHMTVFDNVAFPLRYGAQSAPGKAEIVRLVGAALETVNLPGFQDRSPTQLSGGQQQRVALARAIVRRPRLLLLDEPLSNLDVLLREEMRTELKRLQRQIGITTIYVTHDQDEALEMSDVVGVLNHGQLVQIGPPREVYFRPRDTFVAGFLGATNLLKGTAVTGVAENSDGAVELAGGRRLICRFPNAMHAGLPVTVSVRPETIRVEKLETPGRDGFNRIEGIVIASDFLGHSNRFTIRVGETVLQAHTGPRLMFADGESVAVTVAFEDSIGLGS